MSAFKKFEDNVEIKKYKVTPVKNRFVPDIVKNGRIEEEGIYDLNEREAHRARCYGYLVEEVSKPDQPNPPTPPDEDSDLENGNWMVMSHGKIGRCKLF